MTFGDVVSMVVNGEKRVNCIAVSAFDGFLIQEWKHDGFELDLAAVAAEIAFLLKELSRISDENALSQVRELSFGGSDYFVHVLVVEREYFMFVITSEISLTGKTRFFLRNVVPDLRDTF